jgi:Spy/CpxP family protein refolding chaperone
MKKVFLFSIAATLLAAASISFAQGGGGGGRGGFGQRGGMGGGQQLNRKDVQADLKLTADQIKEIEAINTAGREEMQAMFQGGGGGGDREAMMAQMQAFQKKQQEKIDKVLTPEQSKRLKQIIWQLAGNRAVMNEEVQKALTLTDAQKASIKSLQEKQQAANAAIGEKIQSGEIDRDQRRELMEKNNKILDEEIGKVLTDAQKTTLKGLLGEPFKADPNEAQGRRIPPVA